MANFKHEQRVEFIQGEPVHDVDLENDSGAFLAQDDNLEAPLLPLAVDAVSNRGHAASTKVAAKDKGWATAFKLNVVVTLVAAVCFGKMALDAIASDSLSGAGRRRLQVRGDSGKLLRILCFVSISRVAHFEGTWYCLGTSLISSKCVLLSSFRSSFHLPKRHHIIGYYIW